MPLKMHWRNYKRDIKSVGVAARIKKCFVRMQFYSCRQMLILCRHSNISSPAFGENNCLELYQSRHLCHDAATINVEARIAATNCERRDNFINAIVSSRRYITVAPA